MVNMYTKDKDMIYTLRRALLMLWVFVATTLSAQNISVASFKMLPNDLTANTYGTSEKDFNGEVAALIKVVTSEQGLVFEGGMVGIVKTRQEVGEVWVYVPHGIKKITVRHQQLGVLRDYFFPIPIEKARTYEMVLTTGRVETVVTHAVTKQYVLFNVSPANASVELGDELLTVDESGCAAKNVPYGTYDYRVSCANYHTTAGKVTVTAAGKAEVNVTLRPNFGWLKLDAADEAYHGAYVYINNERVGQLPYTSDELKSGTYKVRVAKSMYKSYESQVMVADNETTTQQVTLIPNFASVTLVADADGEIWVDGEKKGTGTWSGPLETGDYTVEVRKPSHRTASEIVHVTGTGEKTVQLKSPTPIYASLELESTPLRATVLIDGAEVGETPMMKTDVLVGTHRVVFKKEGYTPVERTVVVRENEENHLSATLTTRGGGAQQASATTGKGQPKAPATDKKKPEKPKAENIKLEKPKAEGQEEDKERHLLIAAGAGYSPYGLRYGAEAGFMLKGITLTLGANAGAIGSYTTCMNDVAGSQEEEHGVQLMRFSAKVGYTIGKRFQVTPQVGLLFGPSALAGKEYVLNELPAWDGVSSHDRVLANKDYSQLNAKIMQFVGSSRWGLTLGARIGYTTVSGLGFYATPEYVLGEGVSVNAGISLSF